MRIRVQSLTSLSGLRIRCCRELWYRSQKRQKDKKKKEKKKREQSRELQIEKGGLEVKISKTLAEQADARAGE